MSNKSIDALVFCPFYMSEARTTITCEGIIGEATVTRFKNEAMKRDHEENFCKEKTCRACGVFSAIMGNYHVSPNPIKAIRH